MKNLIKLLSALLLGIVLACFYTLTVPIEDNGGNLILFSPDGRVLEIEEAAATEYLEDGWSVDFNDVTVTVWNETGDNKIVLKDRASGQKGEGWFDSKLDVSVRMKSPEGEMLYVFKGEQSEYESKGWTLVSAEKSSSAPAVALTFDDGPKGKITARLLDILEENNAKATFFILGQVVEDSDENISRMKELGMELGNHTFNHTDLSKLSAEEIQEQLDKTDDRIKNSADVGTTLIRPPYGAVNDTVKNNADAPIIMWSVDTEDWKTKNPDSICREIRDSVSDGDIILFHDIYSTTVTAAEIIIPELKSKGYELVTVSELAEMKGIELENGQVYHEF